MIINCRGLSWLNVALVVGLAAVGLLGGCGNDKGTSDKGAKVDTSLTETIVRERITSYLLDTLRALPAGVGLSHTPDNTDLGTFAEPAITVPCNDSDLQTGGPEQVQIRYWVVGVPDDQNARYFELIRNAWTQRGFGLQADADAQWAPVRTPDGYGLNVKYVPNKDHSVSIAAGSPCFPNSGLGTTTPQPTELKHPS